ncbi:MAG: hypothetical protein ACREJ2_09980 [Planctomycetota bacterium]
MKRHWIALGTVSLVMGVLLNCPAWAEESTSSVPDQVLKDFLKCRAEAFDKLNASLIVEEKDPDKNFWEIAKTLKAFGELGDERAIPLLIARFMVSPPRSGINMLAFCDRFPATVALSHFGFKCADAVLDEALKCKAEYAMLNLAYYLTLTAGPDIGDHWLTGKIQKESDAAKKAELQKAEKFVISGIASD